MCRRLILVVVALAFVVAGCGGSSKAAAPSTTSTTLPLTCAAPPAGAAASIQTNFGCIVISLDTVHAPKAAGRFISLAKSGFYNGLTFHRVVPDFIIQGGDPKGDGTGGPGWQVKAEFNKKQHVPGTLSMARSAHPDSAGSQFFVCLTREQCKHLDNQYTAFGQVTKGMDIVEKIAATPVEPRSGRPLKPTKMTKVTATEPKK